MNDINNLEDIIPGIDESLKLQFVAYFEILEKYNRTINLVSVNSLPRSGVKHFSDSFQGLQIVQGFFEKGSPTFDFGSGNGFPGMIAGLMYPDHDFILVERDQRKAEFLKSTAALLSLKNVEVFAGSVTDLKEGACHRVISRAMAPLPKFLLETRQIISKGGVAFLFKGDHWSTEFGAIPPQVFEFWDVSVLQQYELPSNEGSRFIIRCERL